MGLVFGAAPQPLEDQEAPYFELTPFIEAAVKETVEAGEHPLKHFDLDLAHPPVPGRWRPSGMHGCKRRAVYKAAKIRRAPPVFEAARQIQFDFGTLLGAWAYAYVKLLEGRWGFSDIVAEATCYDEELEIGGKADILLTYNGHRYCIECKSKENAGGMRRLTSSPTHVHRQQLNDYMRAQGISAGIVLYLGVVYDPPGGCKECGGAKATRIRFKEFFCRFNPKMEQEAVADVSVLEMYLRDQTGLAPKTSNTLFECPNCPYRYACDQDLTPIQARQNTGG